MTPSGDRQHALRRVRPAAGVDDLQSAQPVPRRHGAGAALLAGARETLQDIWVSTTGGANPSGTGQEQRRSAGTATARRRPRRARRPMRRPRRRNQAHQRASPPLGKSARPSTGAADQHGGGDDGAAGRLEPIRAGQARRWRSTTRACSSPRPSPSTCGPARRSSDATAAIREAMRRIGHAGRDPRQLPGHGRHLRAVAGQPADPDPRGAGRGLHRAGRAL